jgi:hypothetical protein
MKTILWCIIVFLFAGCLWKAINNDSHVVKMFTQDLRNRIVGARLQNDGKDPYFYTWKKEDGIRYYDPNNFDALLVSNITASPFMHHLLYPLAEMPQSKIRITWLVIQYAMLIIMVLLCMRLTTDIVNRFMIIGFALAFLFTEAWKHTVVAGQLYIFIPFLFLLFYYFFRQANRSIYALICGLICIVTILIRPNTMIGFLPLLLLVNHIPFKSKVLFLLPVFSIMAFTLFNSRERNLWRSYQDSIKAHIASHNNEFKKTARVVDADPKFAVWEGMMEEDMINQQKQYAFENNDEAGNLFEVVRILFGIRLQSKALLGLSIFVILVCCTVFYYLFRNTKPVTVNLIIFGYCLYMISDLCSPIYRHQYYTVQWIMPLLLSGAYFSNKYWLLTLLVLAGLVLNILNIDSFHVEHTIGEYIWLAGFMLLSFIISDDKDIKKLRTL